MSLPTQAPSPKNIRPTRAALREAEERAQRLFDMSREAILMLEAGSGIVLEANPALLRLTGYARETLLGKPAWELAAFRAFITGPADLPALLQPVPSPESAPALENARGQRIQIEFNSCSYPWQGRSVIQCNIRDISAQPDQVASELLRSQAQLQAILDCSPALISIKDLRGNVLLANKSFEMLDTPPLNEFIGKNVYDLFPREVAEQLWQNDLAALRSRAPIRTEEVVRHKDGQLHTYFTLKFPIYDDAGQPSGICAISTDISERTKTEQALRESEERFRTLVEQAPSAIFLQTRGQFAYVNPAGLRLLGASDAAQLIGASVLERFPPDAHELAQAGLRQLNEQIKELPSSEATILRLDGSPLQVELSAVPFFFAGEQGALVFLSDITKRKQAENALRASEQNYRLLFDEMLSGMAVHEIICDANGSPMDYRFLAINPAFEKLTGLRAAESIGKKVSEVLSETEPGWIERYGQVALTRNPAQFENYSHALGKYFEVRAFSPEKGKFATVFNDITERRQAENLIRARLRLTEYAATHSLAEILERTLDEVCEITDSPIGFYHFVEKDQKTLSLQAWSTSTRQDYCHAEGKGQHYPVDAAGVWVDAVHKRRAVIHNDYATLPNRKGLPPGHAELKRELVVPILREDLIVALLGVGNKAQEYTQKDVELVWYFADMAWEIAERKRAEQRLAEYTGQLEKLVQERTQELRAAQQQLLQQERLATLGQLAGSVSHELRNPLAIISNAIYYLDMVQPEASAKISQYHEIIKNETKRAEKIIGDLLDYSRLKVVDPEPLQVSDLLNRALERCPAPVNVLVALDLPADLPLIYADELQMGQVLDNLLSNALQAMTAPGGKLNIAARAQDDMIRLCVQDNGVGIPPENMSRLFEPLFTTKNYGIGLGLALSKKLVEANSGRIEAASQPGEGSTFTVFLPVDQGNRPNLKPSGKA